MKKIASLLSRAGIDDLFGVADAQGQSAERDKAKKLDVVAVSGSENMVGKRRERTGNFSLSRSAVCNLFPTHRDFSLSLPPFSPLSSPPYSLLSLAVFAYVLPSSQSRCCPSEVSLQDAPLVSAMWH